MRVFYFLVLLIILAGIGVFAIQNHEPTMITFFNQSISCPLSLVIAAAYVLGMLSGWTVVGFLKRSIERVTERPRE
jgi:uncharacterized integral membrane protein